MSIKARRVRCPKAGSPDSSFGTWVSPRPLPQRTRPSLQTSRIPVIEHHIYRCLNLVFDTAWCGTVVKTPAVATPGRCLEFPISCPVHKRVPQSTCQVKLGEVNMNEWNHAWFLPTLNLIYCPHKGCNETFNVDDVARAPSGVKHAAAVVQCPQCRGSLCKACMQQVLPITERMPEDMVFATLAEQERRCLKCPIMVELKLWCK
ncbi:hypothetical protein B0H14DRAFT_2565865 [Mycena olivaceomarginata]|nr:hypothetical protein B0H14DRAFT_2565865 [Mycena olivaceomarginata]